MATIVVCDVCGKVSGNQSSHNKFEYKIHLNDKNTGYQDTEGNKVSGRYLSVDLCNKCYNKIVGVSVELLKHEQNQRKDDV